MKDVAPLWVRNLFSPKKIGFKPKRSHFEHHQIKVTSGHQLFGEVTIRAPTLFGKIQIRNTLWCPGCLEMVNLQLQSPWAAKKLGGHSADDLTFRSFLSTSGSQSSGK